MNFSSVTFLFFLFPASVGGYALTNLLFRRSITAQNIFLCIMSLAFYGMAGRQALLVVLGLTLGNYLVGYIARMTRRTFAYMGIALDVLVLAVFKYPQAIAAALGSAEPITALYPLGISFIIFHCISYLADLFREDCRPTKSEAHELLLVATYLLFFPKLAQGPIVRYADMRRSLEKRPFTLTQVCAGCERILVGLAKKVLLADAAGKVAAQILDGSAASATTAAAWLGIVLYTFEIYFDFSGYSDMAIGMGRIFGFKYPENFRLPYTSRSITEFWRRWHISLGSFFRDYVYIPLGGKKKHQLLNMAVVWALTGLWHGASWNFVLWGLYFFVILAAEKTIGEKRLRRIPTILRRVGTMLLVILGWNIFYFTDLTQLLQHFGLLFGLLGAGFSNAQTGIQLVNNLPLLLVCAIGATSVPQNLGNLFGGVCVQGGKRSGQIVYACVTFAFDAALLALSTIALVGSTYNAFLYFRF